MLKETLRPVPKSRFISLRLFYNNTAPQGYQPPYFRDCTSQDDHDSFSRAYKQKKFRIGTIETGIVKWIHKRLFSFSCATTQASIQWQSDFTPRKNAWELATRTTTRKSASHTTFNPVSLLKMKVSSEQFVLNELTLVLCFLKTTEEKEFEMVKKAVLENRSGALGKITEIVDLSRTVVRECFSKLVQDGILSKNGTRWNYNHKTPNLVIGRKRFTYEGRDSTANEEFGKRTRKRLGGRTTTILIYICFARS